MPRARRTTLLALTCALAACSSTTSRVDAGDGRDAASADAATLTDADTPEAGPWDSTADGGDEPPDADAPDAARLDADAPDSGSSDAADAAADASVAPTSPLDGAGTLTRVAMGFRFTEGPAWVPALGQLLFTDLQTGTIHALTPPSAVAPWRMPSGGANGLAVDASGLVLAAEHQGRRVTRTLANGDITVVADAWQGMAFNSPNDLTVRRSDGTIYLSDPPWGLNGRPRQIPFNGLFRISPAGVVTAERQYPTAVNPNGVALSPDASRLYVALDTDAKLVVFDVAADGSLSNERDFVATSATPDGLAIDEEGNVYAATSAGIEVFAPDGARWGVITVPQQPANCGFGGASGRTLYVTARTALFAIDLRVRGAD